MMEHIETALKIIGGASVIASATPTKKDDTVLGWLTAVLHFVAFNFGKAKNKAGE